jgi:hypothetical protein
MVQRKIVQKKYNIHFMSNSLFRKSYVLGIANKMFFVVSSKYSASIEASNISATAIHTFLSFFFNGYPQLLQVCSVCSAKFIRCTNLLILSINRKRPTKRYYVKTWPSIDMKHSSYDGSKGTVFLIHGFMSTGNDTWMEDMKNAYLNNVSV